MEWRLLLRKMIKEGVYLQVPNGTVSAITDLSWPPSAALLDLCKVEMRKMRGLYPRPAFTFEMDGRMTQITDAPGMYVHAKGPVRIIVKKFRRKYRSDMPRKLLAECKDMYQRLAEQLVPTWRPTVYFARDRELHRWQGRPDRYVVMNEWKSTITVPALSGASAEFAVTCHHEEGWSSTEYVISFNADTCLFEIAQYHEGSDCDGRHSWSRHYTSKGGDSMWEDVR